MTFSGKTQLPSIEEMEKGVEQEKNIRDLEAKPQFSHNYFRLCDEIAAQIRVLPDFATLMTEDPNLYEMLMNGPFTVACYRLFGFGSNRILP